MGLETAAIMAIVSATTAVAGAGASFAQANIPYYTPSTFDHTSI